MNLDSLTARYRVHGDPLFTERRIELGAVCISALLILQLVYSLFRLSFLSEPESIAPSLDMTTGGSQKVVERVDPALSEEIRSRPLFWASRRPLVTDPSRTVEETVERQSASGELDKVELLGIFGAGKSAGIITLVEGKKRRILVGEELEGWTLDVVELDRAIFKDKGRSLELLLVPRKKGKS